MVTMVVGSMFKFPMLYQRLLALAAIGVDLQLGEKVHFNRFGLRMRAGDRLLIGDQSIVQASLRTDRSPASIVIGSRTFIGGGSLLVAAQNISIGDDVLVSWGVTIVDHDSHSLDFALRKNDVVEWGQGRKDWTHVTVSPVRIGNKVWIGFGVSILKGVDIGEGAVIAAASVVTRDVPPYTLVAGNPARVIREVERSEVEVV